MRDARISHMRHNKINTKYEYDTSYMPKNIGEKEKICTDCKFIDCKGDCKRYREEYKKLKEKL